MTGRLYGPPWRRTTTDVEAQIRVATTFGGYQRFVASYVTRL